jgi:NCS1 family nucleobase:cation symporter-1
MNFIRAPKGAKINATVGNSRWTNKDLEPTPPEYRNWTWYVVDEGSCFCPANDVFN